MKRIVVAGSVAQKPGQGGHTWVFLQYVLGLQRLGWDVLFLDRLSPEMRADGSGAAGPTAGSPQVRYLAGVMRRFGLDGRWALLGGEGSGATLAGLDLASVLAHVRGSELLLDVMGFLGDERVLAAARRRVFLDIDPGFPQMWRALGLADPFARHDDFVTIGRNLGREGCAIPDCGLRWITTHQPVVLEHWPAVEPAAGPFTSVATWRGRYAPIEYRGETYGLRVHGFRRLAPLPRLSGERFELALSIDPADAADRSLLEENGWELVDPREVASDPWAYRRYITGSGAELMVAKDVYVRARSGWFSDRSICYLASGRPVVAEDTGLDGDLPLGEGLLAYRTLDEARDAVAAVAADPRRHARAARRIAEECFDSDRVLPRLLDRLGVEAA